MRIMSRESEAFGLIVKNNVFPDGSRIGYFEKLLSYRKLMKLIYGHSKYVGLMSLQYCDSM